MLNLLENNKDQISEVDRELIDSVIKYFGCYNANILEVITHKEMLWLNARKGLFTNLSKNFTSSILL